MTKVNNNNGMGNAQDNSKYRVEWVTNRTKNENNFKTMINVQKNRLFM